MKRIFTMAVLLPLMLFTLPGCGKERPITANADEFILCVSVQTNDAVMSAAQDYFINGEFLGGQAMNHADGTVLDPDEKIIFRLTAKEFPPGTKTFEGFSFLVKLSAEPPAASIEDVANSVNYTETAQCAPFTPEYGNVYEFTVSGNFADGFILH